MVKNVYICDKCGARDERELDDYFPDRWSIIPLPEPLHTAHLCPDCTLKYYQQLFPNNAQLATALATNTIVSAIPDEKSSGWTRKGVED